LDSNERKEKLMCVWNVVPKASEAVIEDEYGLWVATTRSKLVATEIVKQHNEEEKRKPQLVKIN
jgi:hypothetical protein